MNALTGMNIDAACFLIPIGIAVCKSSLICSLLNPTDGRHRCRIRWPSSYFHLRLVAYPDSVYYHLLIRLQNIVRISSFLTYLVSFKFLFYFR